MMAWRTDEAGHLANGPSDPFHVQGSHLARMSFQVHLIDLNFVLHEDCEVTSEDAILLFGKLFQYWCQIILHDG